MRVAPFFRISGRIGPKSMRVTIFVFALLCFAVITPLAFAAALLDQPEVFGFLRGVGLSVFCFSVLPLLVRRLHDRGKSGLWLLPYIIVPMALMSIAVWQQNVVAELFGLTGAAVFACAFIELFYMKGDNRPNQYGAVPVDG